MLRNWKIEPIISIFLVDEFLSLVNFLLYLLLAGVFFYRENFFAENIENATVNRIDVLFVTLFFLSTAYLFILFKNNFKSNLLKMTLAAIFLMGLVAPPLFSCDTTAYAMGAKLLYSGGLNPYVTSLATQSDFANQLGYVWWIKDAYLYGPVFLLISFIPWLLGSFSLLVSVYIFKILALVAFIASFFIFRQIRQREKLPVQADWLYLFNPALIINIIFEGHNDIFIIFFVLLFIYWQARPIKAGLALLAAAFIKYFVFIFWPLAWFREGRFQLKSFFISNLAAGLLLATFLVLSGSIPYIIGERALFALKDACLYECSPLIKIFAFLPAPLDFIIKTSLFLVVYLVVLIKYLFKDYAPLKFIFWSGLALFFIQMQWLMPWYIGLLIPFGLLIKGRVYYIITYLVTVYSLFHGLGVF